MLHVVDVDIRQIRLFVKKCEKKVGEGILSIISIRLRAGELTQMMQKQCAVCSKEIVKAMKNNKAPDEGPRD